MLKLQKVQLNELEEQKTEDYIFENYFELKKFYLELVDKFIELISFKLKIK